METLVALVDRILDPKTRLAGFLGCLVASMTFGAAVLLWIEPDEVSSVQPILRIPSPERILKDMLATERPLRPDRWTGIRFAQHVVRQGRTLAARADRKQYHFLVDPTGRIVPTDLWRHQRGLGGAVGSIRVGLTRRDKSQAISPAQREALRRLINTLRAACNIPSERVEHEAGTPTGDAATHLASQQLA